MQKEKKLPLGVKIILGIIIALVLFVVIFLLVLTITEYNPEDVETVGLSGTSSKTLSTDEDFTVMTWNLGYGGLSEEADFFMDGGESVRSIDEEGVEENLAAFAEEIENVDADAVFLQEVDANSKRTYYIDEQEAILDSTTGYISSVGTNFKTLYVPYPLPTIGKVDSGIMTLSKYNVSVATRVSLPCSFSWPIRLANLKRCLLVNRLPIEGSDKELVLVNLHLEAYDDGEGKEAQTAQLKAFLQEELAKGNYVIAGGDFNQTFSGTDTSAYPLLSEDMWTPGEIDQTDFSSDFIFVQDATTPTCRSLDKPLAGADTDPSAFQYYVIDGFIVSNNITVKYVETLDLGFKNSDHNPVVMTVSFN